VECGDATTGVGACITISGTTVTAHPCDDSHICSGLEYFGNYEDFEVSTCVSMGSEETVDCPEFDGLPTYSYCCHDADCFSGSCDNNYCAAVGDGELCAVSEDCESDYYCYGFVCVDVLEEGDSCTIDDQCPVGHGCNRLHCVELWSLDPGAVVDSGKYCKSGWTNVDSRCESVSIYVDGTVLEEPFKCTIGDTCTHIGDYNNLSYDTFDCQCAGDGSTKGYCKMEYPTTGFHDEIHSKLQYDSSECAGDSVHTGSVHELVRCESISEDGGDFVQEMNGIISTWSLYQSGVIDDCAEDMLLFDPSVDMDSWNSGEILAVSALVALFY